MLLFIVILKGQIKPALRDILAPFVLTTITNSLGLSGYFEPTRVNRHGTIRFSSKNVARILRSNMEQKVVLAITIKFRPALGYND
jgi:hypothetical protein